MSRLTKYQNRLLKQDYDIVPSKIGLSLVNIYSENNLILNEGDMCLFFLTSSRYFHLPILCRGKVYFTEFLEGATKNYYILFKELVDDIELARKFLFSKPIYIFKYKDGMISYKSLFERNIEEIMFKSSYFERDDKDVRLLRANSFFVRGYREDDVEDYKNKVEEMKLLRKDYLKYIIEDFLGCIDDAKFLFDYYNNKNKENQ